MSTNQPAPKGGKRSTLGTVILVIVIVAAWWFNQQTPANEPTTGQATAIESVNEPAAASVAAEDAEEQAVAVSGASETTGTEETDTEEPTIAEPTSAPAATEVAEEESSPTDPTATSDDEPIATAAPSQAEAAASTPIPQPTATDTPQPKPTATSASRGPPGMPVVAMDELPREAVTTINLIWQNGPFPYNQDDSTFQNREGYLPNEPRGYYREFTVVTPGLNHRGARRIVEGEEGELYYTDDRYDSFSWVEVEE